MAAGEYAVDDKFDKFEQSCRCVDVPGVAYALSSNGYQRSFRIFFVGRVFAHNFGVRNFVAAVDGDIFVSDDPESVSSLDTLFLGPLDPLPMPRHR